MNNEVRALALDGTGNLYAGGIFTTAGGVSAARIAQWDGSSWTNLGSGVNNNILALTCDGSNNLYAGGYFTTAGGKASAYLAKAVLYPAPVIMAGAGSHGAVVPSGVVDVVYGASTSFVVTADQYYHISSLMTNGASVGEVTNRSVYTSVWVNVTATGVLTAAFAENLTTNTGTPEWWLAQYGLTNNFNAAATNDADGDSMPTWAEFHADADPTNRSSVLTIVGIYQTNVEMRIEWKGGTNAWQILEFRKDLVSTIEQWLAICTNLPPTPVTTNYLHDVTTNGVMFYRIKARRE